MNEGASTERKPAAPGVDKDEQWADRTLIEFCCSHSSKASDERYRDGGRCRRIRLTIDEDMRTPEGLEYAMAIVRRCSSNVLLWGSLPCTAGCPWQRLNRRHKGGRRKIAKHRRDFKKLFSNFYTLALEVRKRGGKVAMEWPTGCSLWNEPTVQAMLAELGLEPVHFHGCTLGLVGRNGGMIKKPWTIQTDCIEIRDEFSDRYCPGRSCHPFHEPCAGGNTKNTELYTWEFTDRLHKGFKNGVKYSQARHVATRVSGVSPVTPVAEYPFYQRFCNP